MEQKEEVFEASADTETRKKKRGKLTKADMMNMLEKVYSKSVDGIPHVSPAIDDLANQYLNLDNYVLGILKPEVISQ